MDSGGALNPIWKDPAGLDFTRATQVGSLPIRGEKRLVPVELSDPNNPGGGGDLGDDLSSLTKPTYEAISYAKSTFTDYMTVRVPSRGGTYDGMYTYRFLINPHTLNISRQTVDAHSMTRGGWQFGVWGEDAIELHMTGVTAGNYFEGGLTDRWKEYSVSYRNSMELVNLFENNGYWFEGEEVNQQWSAPDYTRKRIKCHEDVELRVGNFVWKGMFTGMTITHSADTPYFNSFEVNFLAWKERFSDNSPWLNSIRSDMYRGHSKEVLNQEALNQKTTVQNQAQATYQETVNALDSPGPTAAPAPASFSQLLPLPPSARDIFNSLGKK